MQASHRFQPDSARRGAVFLRERVQADLSRFFPFADGGPTAAAPGGAGVDRYRARNGRLHPADGGPRLGRKKMTTAEGGTAGRLVYAVGDVHGRYDLLCGLVAEIALDLERSGE